MFGSLDAALENVKEVCSILEQKWSTPLSEQEDQIVVRLNATKIQIEETIKRMQRYDEMVRRIDE